MVSPCRLDYGWRRQAVGEPVFEFAQRFCSDRFSPTEAVVAGDDLHGRGPFGVRPWTNSRRENQSA